MQQISFLPGEMTPGERSLILRALKTLDRHQHTVTLYAKGLTCEADTLGSCDYVYLAVYPTPEMKN